MKLLRKKIEELEFLLKDKDEEIKRLSKPIEEIKKVITEDIKEEIITNDDNEKSLSLKDLIEQHKKEEEQKEKL